jgi:DNA-binding NtrC family response regulator
MGCPKTGSSKGDCPDLNEYLSPAAKGILERSRERWDENKQVAIVGRSPNLQSVLEKVGMIANFDEPVLITGESGVGKESLAAAIYLLGHRSSGPFVSVNCPQFQEGNLTVSELFGHKRGSFTGAVEDRKGCFEAADGGVIFLDEIGDLHMGAQLMLLRALSSGEFTPLGSNHPRRVNVRVIAATNRPLSATGLGEHFRGDLFFRLRYFHLQLPPLRARGDDWRLLSDFVLERLRCRHGVDRRLSRAAEDILASYTWPGNIRELFSVITSGYALSNGEEIQPEAFSSLIESAPGSVGRRVDDSAIRQMAIGEGDFWTTIHSRFMDRELNRSQVRSVVEWGLSRVNGSYRRVLGLFGLPDDDYQRFMDFLRHHKLKPRKGSGRG